MPPPFCLTFATPNGWAAVEVTKAIQAEILGGQTMLVQIDDGDSYKVNLDGATAAFEHTMRLCAEK